MIPFLAKPKHVVGLDIGSHTIKAIEVMARGGSLAITGYGQIRCPSPEHREQCIRELIHQNNLATDVISSVSGRSVILRYITLQQMPPAELASAVQFQADKYIPFEADKVVLDYQVLEEVPDSKEMKVALVAVKRNFIDQHVTLLQNAGLHSTVIDVDAFALANAFEHNMLNGPAGLSSNGVYALVDIGSEKTTVNIVQDGVSRFSKEIYVAGAEFSKAIGEGMSLDQAQVEALLADVGGKVDEIVELIAITLDDLANEVRLCFDYYESQFESRVDQAFVSGGACQLPGLEKFLERIFDVKTSRWDPTENYQVSLESVNIEEMKRNCSQLAVAAGLATRALYD